MEGSRILVNCREILDADSLASHSWYSNSMRSERALKGPRGVPGLDSVLVVSYGDSVLVSYKALESYFEDYEVHPCGLRVDVGDSKVASLGAIAKLTFISTHGVDFYLTETPE